MRVAAERQTQVIAFEPGCHGQKLDTRHPGDEKQETQALCSASRGNRCRSVRVQDQVLTSQMARLNAPTAVWFHRAIQIFIRAPAFNSVVKSRNLAGHPHMVPSRRITDRDSVRGPGGNGHVSTRVAVSRRPVRSPSRMFPAGQHRLPSRSGEPRPLPPASVHADRRPRAAARRSQDNLGCGWSTHPAQAGAVRAARWNPPRQARGQHIGPSASGQRVTAIRTPASRQARQPAPAPISAKSADGVRTTRAA
jgi:hypothetical protein